MPDDEILSHAAAGDLQRPQVLTAQARRMLKDPRARGLAIEFAGNWLDFRRFEQHNAVDRERFPSFNSEFREAMFEEPVRFIENVIRNDSYIMDCFGNYTFVNPVLAGTLAPGLPGTEHWIRWKMPAASNAWIAGMAVFDAELAGVADESRQARNWVVRRVLAGDSAAAGHDPNVHVGEAAG
jgi:hypothetical protein